MKRSEVNVVNWIAFPEQQWRPGDIVALVMDYRYNDRRVLPVRMSTTLLYGDCKFTFDTVPGGDGRVYDDRPTLADLESFLSAAFGWSWRQAEIDGRSAAPLVEANQ